MQVCESNSHPKAVVVYEVARRCPLCELQTENKELEEAIEGKNSEIHSLEDEINALEETP